MRTHWDSWEACLASSVIIANTLSSTSGQLLEKEKDETRVWPQWIQKGRGALDEEWWLEMAKGRKEVQRWEGDAGAREVGKRVRGAGVASQWCPGDWRPFKSH